MKCIKIVLPSLPTLPTGFGFVIPLPIIPDPSIKLWCCKYKLSDYLTFIPLFPVQWPIRLSLPILAAINAVLSTGQRAVQAYLNGLIPDCPKF
jgi:hypothetical protein